MVKRIKKRVVKSQSDTPDVDAEGVDGGGPADLEAEGDPSASFRAELESLGEDDFTRSVAGGVGWMVENRALLIAGIGIAAAVVIAIIVLQGQKTSGMEEAATAFDDASSTYVEAVRPPTPGTDEKTLTDDERTARIEKAAQAFERTRQAYADQPIRHLSALGEAGSRFDLGDVDAALKLYEQALSAPDVTPMTRAIALQGKAAALEGKGDLDGAMQAWKSVEGVDSEAFGLMAGMQTGRLLEAQGKSAEAKAIYERIQADHAASLDQLANRSLKADLERRVARLGRSS